MCLGASRPNLRLARVRPCVVSWERAPWRAALLETRVLHWPRLAAVGASWEALVDPSLGSTRAAELLSADLHKALQAHAMGLLPTCCAPDQLSDGPLFLLANHAKRRPIAPPPNHIAAEGLRLRPIVQQHPPYRSFHPKARRLQGHLQCCLHLRPPDVWMRDSKPRQTARNERDVVWRWQARPIRRQRTPTCTAAVIVRPWPSLCPLGWRWGWKAPAKGATLSYPRSHEWFEDLQSEPEVRSKRGRNRWGWTKCIRANRIFYQHGQLCGCAHTSFWEVRAVGATDVVDVRRSCNEGSLSAM